MPQIPLYLFTIWNFTLNPAKSPRFIFLHTENAEVPRGARCGGMREKVPCLAEFRRLTPALGVSGLKCPYL